MVAFFFIRTCNWCKTAEERVFTDSYTGWELCLECITRVARRTTNSPASEGDNLGEILTMYALDRRPEEVPV